MIVASVFGPIVGIFGCAISLGIWVDIENKDNVKFKG